MLAWLLLISPQVIICIIFLFNRFFLNLLKQFLVWCGPCRDIAPKFHELAKEHTNIKFVKIDIDQVDEDMESKVMSFSGVPTFRFFKEGELIKEMSGANLNKIKANIDVLLGKSTEIKNAEDLLKDSIYCVSEYSHYEMLTKAGLAVVYFTQSESCIEIEADIQKFAKEYPKIKFIKLDSDEIEDEIAEKVEEPNDLPTFRFLKEGKLIEEVLGLNIDQVKLNIEKLIKNLTEPKESIIEENNDSDKTQEKKAELLN